MVLRSLVAWSQQGIAATIESTTSLDEAKTPTEESPRPLTPNPGPGNRATSQGEMSTRAQLIDDPEQFEALKYRKTALQDAIQKFNFKPKKVWRFITLLKVGCRRICAGRVHQIKGTK
jgi:brefeldin A-inhibited guanine nucleotide-exchange protein